jgi:hypothetical protein
VDDILYSEDIGDVYHNLSSRHRLAPSQLPTFLFCCSTVGAPILSNNILNADAEIVD